MKREIVNTTALFKKQTEIKLPTNKEQTKEIITPSTNLAPKKVTGIKKNKSKENYNYRVIFDDDIQDYVTNQMYLTHIKSLNKYINSLVRDDLNKRLGTNNLIGQDLLKEWEKDKLKRGI